MSGLDDNDPNDPIFHNKFSVGIAVPFCIVAGIVVCCVVVYVRRRRLQQRRNGLSLDQRGRLALQRDILEDGLGGTDTHSTNTTHNNSHSHSDEFGLQAYSQYGLSGHSGRVARGYSAHGHTTDPPPFNSMNSAPGQRRVRETGGRRQPRVANRWAWTSNAERGTGTRSMRTEGLDEHGQPPPPYKSYDPQRKAAEAAAIAVVEEDEVVAEASPISVPTPAHIRRGAEEQQPRGETERIRSLDGETIAATATTTTAASTRPRPLSGSTTLDGIATSHMATSTAESLSSTTPTPPSTSPPAYSEIPPARRADRS